MVVLNQIHSLCVATIYVYEVAGGQKEKPDIIAAANSLGVQWAKTTVDCL